jgi:hypothetical protein
MAIWNILQTFGIFYDHLVHFMFIWDIFPVLVSCTKKNLATMAKIATAVNFSTLLIMSTKVKRFKRLRGQIN